MKGWIAGLAVVVVASVGQVQAALVTERFESTGLGEGDALTTHIGGLTFENAILAEIDTEAYAFNWAAVGPDRGNSAPFDGTDGRFFITDSWGPDASDPLAFAYDTGPVVIKFADPVYNLSFFIADINGPSVDEREIMTARVYSAAMGGTLLETLVLEGGGRATDGAVDYVGFTTSGIKRLEIDVNTLHSSGVLGFGVDNLSYSPVPEPSTLIIWSLLGALGLSVAWWRRKSV